MGYRLAPGLHFCVAGSKATFLDLNVNQYFQVPPAEDTVFQRLVSRSSPLIGDHAHLAHLQEMGILTVDPSPDEIPMAVTATPPARSLPDEVAFSPKVVPLTTALSYQLLASAKLATTPIHALLHQIASKRQVRPGQKFKRPPIELNRAVAAFATSTLLFSSSDKCLRRSIAMVYYLADRGLTADLVVGIKDRPFEAHAWVQSGETVLNDSLGKIIEYTPMVVI